MQSSLCVCSFRFDFLFVFFFACLLKCFFYFLFIRNCCIWANWWWFYLCVFDCCHQQNLTKMKMQIDAKPIDDYHFRKLNKIRISPRRIGIHLRLPAAAASNLNITTHLCCIAQNECIYILVHSFCQSPESKFKCNCMIQYKIQYIIMVLVQSRRTHTKRKVNNEERESKIEEQNAFYVETLNDNKIIGCVRKSSFLCG